RPNQAAPPPAPAAPPRLVLSLLQKRAGVVIPSEARAARGARDLLCRRARFETCLKAGPSLARARSLGMTCASRFLRIRRERLEAWPTVFPSPATPPASNATS